MARLLRTSVLLLMAASFMAVKCDKIRDADHWQGSDMGCPGCKNAVGNAGRGAKLSTQFHELDEITLQKTQTKPDVEENILNDVEEKSSTASSKVYNEENGFKAQSKSKKDSNQPKALGKSIANSTLSEDSSSESSSGESDSEESSESSDSEKSSTTSDSSSDESDSEDSRKGSTRKGEPEKDSMGQKVSSKGSSFQKKVSPKLPHQNEEYNANSNLNKGSDKETGLYEETSRESSLKKLNNDIRGPMEFQDYDEITVGNVMADQEAGEPLDFKDSDRITLEDMLVELQAEGYMDLEDSDRIPLEAAHLKPDEEGNTEFTNFNEDVLIGLEKKFRTAAREYNEDDDSIEKSKTHTVLGNDFDWPTKTLGDSQTGKNPTTRSYLRELSSEETSSGESNSEQESSDSSDSEADSSKEPKQNEESSKGCKLNEESRNSSKRKKNSLKGSSKGESNDDSQRKEVTRKNSNFEDECEQLSLNEDSNKETLFIEKAREYPSLNKDFGVKNTLNEESFKESGLEKASEKISLEDAIVKRDPRGPLKSIQFDENTLKGTKVKSDATRKKMHSEHPEFQDWSRANPASVKDSTSQTNTFGDSDPKKGSADSGQGKAIPSEGSSSEGLSSEENSTESDSEQDSSSGESDSGQESSDDSDLEDSKGSKAKGESRSDLKETGDSAEGSTRKRESGRHSKGEDESSKSSILQEKSAVLEDDSYSRDMIREHSSSVDAFPSKAGEESDLKVFADSYSEEMFSQESIPDSLIDKGVRQDFFYDEYSESRESYSANSDLEKNSFRDCHSEESLESGSNSFGEEWVNADYFTDKSAMDEMFSLDYVTKEGFSADYITEEDSTVDPDSEGMSIEDSFVEEEINESDFSEDGSSINSDLETGFESEDESGFYYDEDNFAKDEESGEYPSFDDVDRKKLYLNNRENVDIEERGIEASALEEESSIVPKYVKDSFQDVKHYGDEPTSPTVLADCIAPQKNSKDRAKMSNTPVPGTVFYCHSRDHNADVGFAAMAPYNATATINRTVDKIIPKECKPQQLWTIIRAGTFSAKKAHMKRFRNKLPGLRREILDAYMSDKSSLCAQDLALLRSWRIEHMNAGPKGSLTPKGKQEIETIANNFKTAFPHLLYKPVPLGKKPSPDIDDKPGKGTRVAFAPTPQTYESAVVFLQGLYGNAWGHVGLPIRGISILQFGDHCSKYINEVLMKPKHEKPYQAFKKGKDMKGVLQRVSERLGINMTVPKLRVMYNACRYQKAWNPNVTSPWCVVFTRLDLKILEYWEDLRMHFDHGHVHHASYKQACVLAKDIMMNFRQKMAANHSAVDAIVYFINTEAIISFTALLDLFKDPAPLRDSFNPSRLWKTSKFAGSGSNYAFVLSACTNNRWWVSATLNEAPFQLPGCTSPFGCSWDTFVRGPFGAHEKCDLSKICGSTAKNMWNSKRWHTYYIENNWM